jgi:transglutaminase-like putative cysteine protease
MNSRPYSNPRERKRVTKMRNHRILLCAMFCVLAAVRPARAGDSAPAWMHALVSVPLPDHDEKTNAVVLLSERNVNVQSMDKVKIHVRMVYKILRPEGRERGTVWVYFNPSRKITNLRGWCIPAQGKDYEVKDKDALEVAAPAEGGSLIDDTKYKILHIPAPDPGNLVGYEYEAEEQPFWLQDEWEFQGLDPVRESHYSLQLPAGWVFKPAWIAHTEVKPDETGGGQLSWAVSDVKGIRPERDMPPRESVAGQMIVTFFPSGTSSKDMFATWDGIGSWFGHLANGRTDTSEAIKQEVRTLTSAKASLLPKMQAIAWFVQHDIRYVAISLGIGGFQPHAASDVFTHRYGDCKDKATLMRAMLREIGVDSYHVVISTERGSVSSDTPAHNAFNHVILAIKLPEDLKDGSLVAVREDPKLGRILFFDPTYDVTIPFGQIGGYLQGNYGLLVNRDGGELVELPQQPTSMNGIQRTAKLTVDLSGTLKGNVSEVRLGDRASVERRRLWAVTKSSEKIKPIEDLLAGSLSSFQIVKATLVNVDQTNQPFGFDYTFQSNNYAKQAGNLLLVRPRVLGNKSSGILETKDPRKFPVEFEGPSRDTDSFDITLPPGYVVDELPPPMDADYSFASYHSKTVANGNVLHYERNLEIKELSVPVDKIEQLKKFYRMIATDERNTAVLRPAVPGEVGVSAITPPPAKPN